MIKATNEPMSWPKIHVAADEPPITTPVLEAEVRMDSGRCDVCAGKGKVRGVRCPACNGRKIVFYAAWAIIHPRP